MEATMKTSYVVCTPSGIVTSFQEVWRAWGDRPVYTWRVDKGEPPHDFGSHKAAWKFIVSVWCCASTRREREERDSWFVDRIRPE